MSSFNEPVFTGRIASLVRAQEHLSQAGIESRTTRPRVGDGILKVSQRQARQARALLKGYKGQGRIMSNTEAAQYSCHLCHETLSEGAMYCPNCNSLVGDPQGK